MDKLLLYRWGVGVYGEGLVWGLEGHFIGVIRCRGHRSRFGGFAGDGEVGSNSAPGSGSPRLTKGGGVLWWLWLVAVCGGRGWGLFVVAVAGGVSPVCP